MEDELGGLREELESKMRTLQLSYTGMTPRRSAWQKEHESEKDELTQKLNQAQQQAADEKMALMAVGIDGRRWPARSRWCRWRGGYRCRWGKKIENCPKTQKHALTAELALSASMGFVLSVSGSLPLSLPVKLFFVPWLQPQCKKRKIAVLCACKRFAGRSRKFCDEKWPPGAR